MNTVQLIVVCVSALLAIGLVAYARDRGARAAIDADERRARWHAEATAVRRDDDERRAAASGRAAGPQDGASLVVHVDGRAVRGARVLAGDPAAAGWVVLDDAAILSGGQAQELGGRQWFREDRVTQLQEL